MRDDIFVRAMLYHIRDDDNACTILSKLVQNARTVSTMI